MQSKSAISHELENMKVAAQELSKAVDGFAFLKNSIGILYYTAEINSYDLMHELKKILPFNIIGCTAQAVLDNKRGMHEFSSILTVLTCDDCSFDIFVSDPLKSNNIRQRVGEVCRAAMRTSAKDTKLVLFNAPFIAGVILDDYPDAFSEFTDGKPVFGGIAGYSAAKNFTAVNLNENIYTDRFICCFVSGNIDPIFSIGGHISSGISQTQIVTKARDNVVYAVGELNFIEYLESVGITTKLPEEYETDFLLASVTLNVKWGDKPDSDGIGVYRSIFALNEQDGSGSALGKVPEGSEVCAVTYKKDDIAVSAQACVDMLMQRIKQAEQNGRKYSTILCGSCNGRYMFMFPSKNIEGGIITGSVPPEINFAGYYTYGEICPTSIKNGIAVNKAHNATLTMCAF